jgi:regulator of nucleoside diphosphate kinase
MHTSSVHPAISSTDYGKLAAIATSGMRFRRIPPTARLLSNELARARVVAPPDLPNDVISMHGTFDFEDGVTDQVRQTTLVYPGEEDAGAARISVLSPLGVALIGSAAGQAVRWRAASGELRTLRVVRVLPRPREGECP